MSSNRSGEAPVDDLVEWVEVVPGLALVATTRGAVEHLVQPFGDPFAVPMQGQGSEATTAVLLDGALAAAWRRRPDRPAPPMTPHLWAWRLVGIVHAAGATPRCMRVAAERFHAGGRSDLAAWADEIAREESGHSELALTDLEALGYDAPALAAAICPPTGRALVDTLERIVAGPDPVESFGHGHALERASTFTTGAHIAGIEAVLPAGIHATRCLRLHSSIGLDVHHVRDSAARISRLAAADRTRVARACYEAGIVLWSRLPGDDPSDAELDPLLAPYRR
jgi:hypothetical protein